MRNTGEKKRIRRAIGGVLAVLLICLLLTKCDGKPNLVLNAERETVSSRESLASRNVPASAIQAAIADESPIQQTDQEPEEVKIELPLAAHEEKASPALSPPAAGSRLGKIHPDQKEEEARGIHVPDETEPERSGRTEMNQAVIPPPSLTPGIGSLEVSAPNPPEQMEAPRPPQTDEESPGEVMAYEEDHLEEWDISEPEPLCPGRPDTEGGVAEAGQPSGKSFTDPVTGMSFVLVRGGCFEMGFEPGGPDEKPRHEVCVDDFYLGEYEVTQAQYEWIMGHNPSSFEVCDFPVDSVSWEDAQTYIRKLSGESGRTYRLPSEAEWEYAARSGWKENADAAVDESLLMEYAGYIENLGKRSDSSERGPNGWGLYDMSGNVWEWVSDWYSAKYYADSPRTNPQGPGSGAHRVVRTGSGSRHGESQFTKRYGVAPGQRENYLGFRVAYSASAVRGENETSSIANPYPLRQE